MAAKPENRSILLDHLARLVVPILLAFSLFLLLRGHDLPGGGFVGGLTAASAFLILGLAQGPGAVKEALKIAPMRLVGIGLCVAILSGVPGAVATGSWMKGVWWTIPLATGPVKIGTPFLFDCGVALIVLGMTASIYLSLGDDD